MEAEKIYCGSDPMSLAMMNNSNNMNNPMWLIWLIAMRWLGNGENNSEIESLRNQISDNKNATDLLSAITSNGAAMQEIANRTNTSIDFVRQSLCSLDKSLAEVGGAVGHTGERVVNAVLMGNKDLTAMMQNCCCENKQLVTTMGYEGQLRDQANTAAIMSRVDQLASGVQTGFAQVGYATAQQTCEIKSTITEGNQRIIDTLNNHWNNAQALELQDTKFKLSQLEQNQYLLSQLKSCGCGCN